MLKINNMQSAGGVKKAVSTILPAMFLMILFCCDAKAQGTPTPITLGPEVSPAQTAATPPSAAAVSTEVNPMTGAPVDTVAATDTQSTSGTYETLDPAAFSNLEKAMKSMANLRKNVVKPEEVGTLVFTLWQHSLLQDAKRLFTTRRPTDGEISSVGDGTATPAPPQRGIRELSLSGILFKGKDNWIIWLNGQRIAPDAIPKEIIDMKVSEAHVDLKWFDGYTNLIYPIRIRPHQRFNLDTRIFLPGITADAAAQLQAATTGSP